VIAALNTSKGVLQRVCSPAHPQQAHNLNCRRQENTNKVGLKRLDGASRRSLHIPGWQRGQVKKRWSAAEHLCSDRQVNRRSKNSG